MNLHNTLTWEDIREAQLVAEKLLGFWHCEPRSQGLPRRYCFSDAEIAVVLDTSPKAVSVMARSALKKIRENPKYQHLRDFVD